MSRKTIDRTGEVGYNNFGSEMVIVKYRNCHDVDVYFEEYNYVVESVYYSTFKNGEIKCPYEPRVYEHGCLGEGKYKSKENGKYTKCYTTWKNMLRRCYDSKFHEKHHTYNQCKASDEWLNYQNFGYWNSENYYEIEGQRTTLDKDILVKNNKIYSAETCIYVPEKINLLFTKRDSKRGKYPVGVCYEKRTKKFRVGCSLLNPETGKSEQTYLGDYNTPEQAFEVYKEFKENNIKLVADYYKDKIPTKLYDVMYNYQVEITD